MKEDARGVKRKLTNLRLRTAALVLYLDEVVVPDLNTSRKSKCEELVEQVRRLLPTVMLSPDDDENGED